MPPLLERSPFQVPELLDRVIDYLHYDQNSLRSCAMVTRAWLPSCRFHLLDETTIVGSEGFETLLMRLKESPEVGLYLRRLNISIFLPIPPSPYGELSRVLDFIAAAPKLNSLTLSNTDWSLDVLTTVPPLTAASVRDLSIESCTFAVPATLAHLLDAFPSLKRLSIQGSTFDVPGETDTILHPTVRKISVEELSLAYITEVSMAETIVRALDDRSLRTLHFSFLHADDLDTIDVVTTLAGTHIEEFNIKYINDYNGQYFSFVCPSSEFTR